MSLMSIVLGWVNRRLSWVLASTTWISTVKPRSLLAWMPISLIAEYDWPTCRSLMSLRFCAQIVGKPRIASDPMATPAPPAAAFSTCRRDTRVLGVFVVSVISFPSP